MTDAQDQKKNAAENAQLPGVGGVLRAARLQKGWGLEEISSAVHIRVGQLRAIEEGDLAALPGMTYAVGFVKIYAGHLKLDSAEMARRFRAEHAQEDPKKNLHMPETAPSSGSQPSIAVIGAAALAAVVLLVSWAMLSKGGDAVVAETQEAIPSAPVVGTVTGIDQKQQTPPPAETPLEAAAEKPATPPVQEKKEEAAAAPPSPPAPAPSPVLAAPAPAEVASKPAETAEKAEPAESAPVKAEEKKPAEEDKKTISAVKDSRTAGGEAKKQDDAQAAKKEEKPAEEIRIAPGKSRVTLAAKQSVWVEVRDGKGKTVFKKVLKSGEKFAVPDQPGLVLLTTNAGGLDLVVDGSKVQSIGRPGEIVRGVSLKPESLKVTKVKVRDR